VILFFVSTFTKAQFYNGSQMTFGKNRIQYSERFWTFYRFTKFDTYFYLGGKSLAIFTAKVAEPNIRRIEKMLDFTLEDKIQFVVFNKLSDLKQSNIGLVNDDKYNTGGVTHIVGSKVFLYFEGDHKKFERQIRAGIAQIMLNQLLYGSHITAKIKNSALLSLPEWYLQGLVSFLSEDWNTEIDNRVRDAILSGKYDRFNQLTGEDAVYAGHSIWHFVYEKYKENGVNVIPNIIYMTKVSKNVESGFLFVIGTSFKSLVYEWLDYYDKKYYDEDSKLSLPDSKPLVRKINTDAVYSKIKLSPDGKYLAYTTNELGRYKVYLYNLETKKIRRIMKKGILMDEKVDVSYPLLAWHPSGKLVSIIIESKGKHFLYFYDIENRHFDKARLFDVEKILDFSYSQNGKLLVMSTVVNGQSDIYVYNIASHTYEPITKDSYDDLYPCFINNSTKIVFSSNRNFDSIFFETKPIFNGFQKNFDLFVYDYTTKNKVLKNITNTPLNDEFRPVEYSKNFISYLSDQSGISNSYIARFDSAILYVDTITHYRYFTSTFPITNYPRSIIEQDLCQKTSKTAQLILSKGIYQIYMNDMVDVNFIPKIRPDQTLYMNEIIQNEKIKLKTDSILKAIMNDTTNQKPINNLNMEQPSDSGKIDINNYTFGKPGKKKLQTEQPKHQLLVAKIDSSGKPLPDNFALPTVLNYDVEYSINQLVSQADFSYLNAMYQPFRSTDLTYKNPGFNTLFKVGINDLLEDYRITAGVRLGMSLSNNEYMISFNNMKYRVDKEIIFHRQRMDEFNADAYIKHYIHGLYYVLKWPFNEAASLRGTFSFKNDRSVFASSDLYNLQKPDIMNNWGGIKGEFVFDNTRDKGLNLYYGTRYKIFAEYYKQIQADSKNLIVLGLDYRKYTKISRTFIWANRFATSTSLGNNRLLYFLGGVDDWLFPKFNSNINIATDQHYAYQTLATNMRGFTQNIRNGNSFAVINSELRFPIFKYLMNRPMKSDFASNFQIVGFGDVGSAWTGTNPFADDNALYTQIVYHYPITVIVTKQIQPLVGGFGFGFRSRLFGYFVRTDWAWGVEDGYINKAVFYLSFGLDF